MMTPESLTRIEPETLTSNGVPTTLAEAFAALPDPRGGPALRHDLLVLLLIALLTLICGGEGFTDMERFARAKQTWLRERLGLSLAGGIPSHDTFGRLFARLDPSAFGACFLAWTQTLQERTQGQIVALDGKALRHSFDTAAGQAALHLVSAWAADNRLVLGQVAVDDKSNEITAIPALLAMLDISGCVVTTDAMGCQKAIAAQVREQEGDYVLALKGNQTSLTTMCSCSSRRRGRTTSSARIPSAGLRMGIARRWRRTMGASKELLKRAAVGSSRDHRWSGWTKRRTGQGFRAWRR